MFRNFTDNFGYYMSNWGYTLGVSLAASVLALILGLSFAALALRFKLVRMLFTPVVAITQSFPLQAIAPLILIVLGVSFHTKLVIAFIIAFFPIYSICTSSFLSIPAKYSNIIKIDRASFFRSFLYIYLPYNLPVIISACKVGFTLSVLGAVVAEFIQPDKGLGKIILIAESNFDINSIGICISILIVQGLLFYIPLTILEKHFLHKLHL